MRLQQENRVIKCRLSLVEGNKRPSPEGTCCSPSTRFRRYFFTGVSMPSKYWIKLYHEILDDPKMGRLPDILFRRTIEVFLLAGDFNQGGLLPSLSDMAWRLRANEESLESDLIELIRHGIIKQDGGDYSVAHFAERQAAMSPAEKMRRQRAEKKKDEYYQFVPDPVTGRVTEGNTDIDIDKEIDTDSDIEQTPENTELFQAIVKKFTEMTGIKKPRNTNHLQERWFQPIFDIMDIAELDQSTALWLVADGIYRNQSENLNISSPKSILSSINTIVAGKRLGDKDANTSPTRKWYREQFGKDPDW